MIRLASIAICLTLASCATVPRAIIPPKTEIERLNVAPVVDAGRATRDAVREVASAGQASREAGRRVGDSTRRLTESLALAEALAEAHAEIAAALADTRRLAAEMEASVTDLTAALAFAEEREKIAILTVDDMEGIIDRLQAQSAAQAVQISYAAQAEETLRQQVLALSESADKRVIAEDKLRFWRWRFAPISIGIIVTGILFTIYRPRIPFL